MGDTVRRTAALLLLAAMLPVAPVRADADDVTPNLTVDLRLPYAGGTELATDGRYVFAGQWNGRFDRDERPRQGGVRILDSQATPPRLVGTIGCAGTDIDVAVSRPGLLVIAHHRSACGVRGNGVTTFDVSNPAKPRRLGSVAVPSAHTLTAVPGTTLVYVSPGGLTNGDGQTAIVDVANPAKPRVAKLFAPDWWGCHDTTFAKSVLGTPLGVCTGGRGVHLWDMTNPLAPRPLSYIGDNDDIYFSHGSAVSPDGGLLVVNDEAYAGHDCTGSGKSGAGALHLYDITRPDAPWYLGRIDPPRGARSRGVYGHVETWCTSHQLNFVPGSRRLVNAWFSGGVSVWDLTVPSAPREEAHYRANGAVVWTAHWLNGRIWVNDMARGLEVLSLSPVPSVPLPVAETFVPAWVARRRSPAPPRGERPPLFCPLPFA